MIATAQTAELADVLVLWDIDGTLIPCGPATAAIYPQAFLALAGRPAEHKVDIHGRTEPDTMKELFARHGLAEPPDDLVGEALTVALRSRIAELCIGGRALPGAAETLTYLAQAPGVLQTVLTGNLRENAELKLRAFGLAELVDLDIGGYGDDHRVRSRLVDVVRRRSVHRCSADLEIVLIGDTMRDVQTALDNGVRMVAVATGPTSASDLLAAGADVVLADLTDPATVLAAVVGRDREPCP